MMALGYRHAAAHLLDGVPLSDTIEAVKRIPAGTQTAVTWLSSEPDLSASPRRGGPSHAGCCQNVLVLTVIRVKYGLRNFGRRRMILQSSIRAAVVDLENRLDS